MKARTLKSTIVFFLSLLLVLAITSFVTEPGKTDSKDLTKNPELKNDVYNQILNNKELFTEFMNDMMQNSRSMEWMMDNGGMMNYMFSGDHLGYMMRHNSGMNQMMMQNMMHTIASDSTYCHQWNNMMENHYGNMHHGMMMMQN